MTDLEMSVISLISSAGDSKAKAFEALKAVKTGEYDKARELLAESYKVDLEAHKEQTKLIQQEMDPEADKTPITLLMVHAQDHYMTSQLARDLIETLIEVFESKEGGK
ncbi:MULTISPECIES: PTS lactose/cellobiose transporter subunit IIA [Bacillota]|jgi:PTS system cellobiose-specific IIA component|uniref:PTS lactose/cellobiose transporter subunit IIA n=2 Tax=Amedibacillus TaxID=2749846 RepID=A0A7G9GTJ7_9FIRM|nr:MULTISPECIES: PTS lactose/cellobiose transporter subunit IIA [Bacillota]QNM14129.1 PTS lactose/cellobiose transporter subunit IIA [[Eubacterium] hominis]MCH4287436.1 PTS lactose/cellobiose transporter subunit IIA [Amedibacillus hominis]RGB48517.1 PTS lactose/cellobiose transporter subunit IIA [Absiella sp. AM22-9]RGB52203.1 PTS lactose/cellobiose transporter subunit IIA [Absiella sp. AM10-20]RGB62044.1 PTS lactose/cellobiose transporter subunit IIA [Absiella sp. AM09-45]